LRNIFKAHGNHQAQSGNVFEILWSQLKKSR
jgi:hypothetical protein